MAQEREMYLAYQQTDAGFHARRVLTSAFSVHGCGLLINGAFHVILPAYAHFLVAFGNNFTFLPIPS
jgi:hypothetical protein